MDLGPGEGAGHVDGGVLPDPPLGAGEPADVEAIELDELPRHIGLQMAGSEPWRRLRLRRGGIARHQREPQPAGAQAVTAEDVVDAARRDHQAAPHRLPQLGRDPPRAQAGVTQGEGDHPLLQLGRHLVGHPRPPSFPRAEHLQPLAQHLVAQPVVAGAVVAELAAGLAYPHLAGSSEKLDPVAEEQVIIGHGRPSSGR